MKLKIIIASINLMTLYSCCYSQKITAKLEEQNVLSKAEIAPYLGKKNVVFYSKFISTGNYSESNGIKISIIEAYSNDSIVQFALVFKMDEFDKYYRMQTTVFKNKYESYVLGRIYTENCNTDKNCLCIHFEKIEPFRTDTLNMKFTHRMTKIISKDSVSVCR